MKVSSTLSRILVACAVVASTSVFGVSDVVKAAPAVPFMDHQAAYKLGLVKTRNGASIDSANGRILYSFSGNACDGYTSDFRQVSELDMGEGKSSQSDLRSTSWEDGNGKSYRFKIETRMNDDSSAVDGVAERSGDQVTVKLTKPEAKTFKLDGSVIFPTQQIHRIIEAAREGKSLLQLTIYDGSDNGQKVYSTLAVIGKAIPGDQTTGTADPSTGSDQMKSLTRWPVTVSYYDHNSKAKDGEQTPVYAMSFELYENGVSRSLVLDYNDFVISGTMDKFDAKNAKPCK